MCWFERPFWIDPVQTLYWGTNISWPISMLKDSSYPNAARDWITLPLHCFHLSWSFRRLPNAYGEWMCLVDFLPFFQKKTTFVTFCMISYTWAPLKKRIYTERKEFSTQELNLSLYSRPLFTKKFNQLLAIASLPSPSYLDLEIQTLMYGCI